MIQIIKRKEGEKSELTTLPSGRIQISYNSDGHLCLRLIHNSESDTLIVLNQSVSAATMRFVRLISKNHRDDLPF